MNSSPRLVVALDFDDVNSCLSLVDSLSPDQCRLKVGKQLFTLAGPALIEKLTAKGFDIFLDLKYHDIPNTVAKAVTAACDLGVWMVNVHASGGERMMQAAAEAVAGAAHKPLLIAVTVLTSMEQADLNGIGIDGSVEQQVMRLADLTKKSGLDGVVCSAQEAPLLRSRLGDDFCLVTPGIRLASLGDDQRRVLTPKEAILAGSHYIVVGRPITQAIDPLAVCCEINRSIEEL